MCIITSLYTLQKKKQNEKFNKSCDLLFLDLYELKQNNKIGK